MGRAWAIIERELRRFRRSPVLIAMSMTMPIVQLVVLGYAFGGNVKHLKVAIVDQDHGVPAVKVRELTSAMASAARTIDTIDYADQGQALTDLRNGRVNRVLTIPPEFSRRVLARNEPRIALIEDNTDSFVSTALAGTLGGMLAAYNLPARAPRIPGQATLDVVEVYPYVPYVQYLLVIGSFIAGIPNPLDPMRLFRMFVVISITAFALISFMFLLMVRVTDPLLPRAMFGVLNTVLYFPSGAVYPQQGFPGWMQAIAVVDPFTYAVHAFKCLLLKNTGFAAISYDLMFLGIFTVVAITAATSLFKRT